MCQMSEGCAREDYLRDLKFQKEFEQSEVERKIREPIEQAERRKRYLEILEDAKREMKRIGWE